MPLTAIKNDGDVVYSPEMTNANRKKDFYFCRNCHAEMRLRIPKKKITHFAHLSKGCGLAGESMQHMEAKKWIFDQYRNDKKYRSVEMERRLWNDERIGDVVLYPKNIELHPTVIEIQNSSMSVAELHARFADWNGEDHAMLWIVTRNVIDPFAEDEVRVPAWVKLLHRLFIGRVYVYHDNNIYAVHLESVTRYNDYTGAEYYLKSTKTVNSRKVRKYDLLQTTTYKGNNELISRFYDKRFWN